MAKDSAEMAALRKQARQLGYNTAGFVGMLAIGVTWQLAYAPYVSDYSRYMPQDGGAKQAFCAAVPPAVFVAATSALNAISVRASK